MVVVVVGLEVQLEVLLRVLAVQRQGLLGIY
jgi:hypothetical protein